MLNDEIRNLKEKWQNILGLEEWDITLNILSEDDFNKLIFRYNLNERTLACMSMSLDQYSDLENNTNGFVIIPFDHKRATITLKEEINDCEYHLVHELVHILLSDYHYILKGITRINGHYEEWRSLEVKWLERIVINIAKSLVNMKTNCFSMS